MRDLKDFLMMMAGTPSGPGAEEEDCLLIASMISLGAKN